MLSDSESEINDIQLTINEHYAKAYAYKKEREELGRLREKYGSEPENDTEEDSEDEETEDEDGEELTPAVDAAILRTLARIKRKDPEIYNTEENIFEQEQKRKCQTALSSKISAKDNTKPLTIKQHALSSMLNVGSRSPSPELQIATHDQEQNALRSETISAFHHALDNEDDEDGDGLLVPRERMKDEVEREDEEYRAFLQREVGEDIRGLIDIEDNRGVDLDVEEVTPTKDIKKKREKGKDNGETKEETSQEFLLNYILNRGWIDRSSKRLPTYKDITHTVPEGLSESQDVHKDDGEDDAAQLMEDNNFDEIVDRFESSYNFRFEEPDAAVIQTYPRGIESAVRRPDTTRKEARERRSQRKEAELLKKKEEIKRLKALKMKELREKIEKISREGGVDVDIKAFTEFDLDGDWDPEKHDVQMAGLYAEDCQEDVEKPQWDNEIDIGDIVGNDLAVDPSAPIDQPKKRKKKKKKDEIITDGVDVKDMDAEQDEEEWDGTEEMRKRKVQEYMDEVYGMDFNDMVGDMPTRFKYTSVTPHSYALTPAEMLLATDADLNEYMGIKKFAPYRKDSKWDVKRVERLKEFRRKLPERRLGFEDANYEGEEYPKTKRRKGKKERQRAKAAEEVAEERPVRAEPTGKKQKMA